MMDQSGDGARLDADVVAFVKGPVATVVATRGEDLRAEIVRAWGTEVSGDGATVTLCVPGPPGSCARLNLEANGAIAVNFTSPTSYRAVQVKGEALGSGEPTEEQRRRMQEHVAAFTDEVRRVGVTAMQVRALIEPEYVAVTFLVRELYDQTPGPGAGARL